MTDVHGIIVFGGTFPAEIWNDVYTNGDIPCEEFSEPSQQISWAAYYGNYTQGGPNDRGGGVNGGGKGGRAGEELPGQAAVGGYDPNAYAPGAGQKPAPLPPPLPESGVGGGEAAGE
jgi:hypothetical protein